jgi:hypothetical protein
MESALRLNVLMRNPSVRRATKVVSPTKHRANRFLDSGRSGSVVFSFITVSVNFKFQE